MPTRSPTSPRNTAYQASIRLDESLHVRARQQSIAQPRELVGREGEPQGEVDLAELRCRFRLEDAVADLRVHPVAGLEDRDQRLAIRELEVALGRDRHAVADVVEESSYPHNPRRATGRGGELVVGREYDGRQRRDLRAQCQAAIGERARVELLDPLGDGGLVGQVDAVGIHERDDALARSPARLVAHRIGEAAAELEGELSKCLGVLGVKLGGIPEVAQERRERRRHVRGFTGPQADLAGKQVEQDLLDVGFRPVPRIRVEIALLQLENRLRVVHPVAEVGAGRSQFLDDPLPLPFSCRVLVVLAAVALVTVGTHRPAG